MRHINTRQRHTRAVAVLALTLSTVAVSTATGSAEAASSAPQVLAPSAMVTETAAVLVKDGVAQLSAVPITASDDPALIGDLQTRLRWVGSLEGAPTGVFGPETTAAVKHFQEKHGLKQTGRADVRTLSKLSTIARDGSIDDRCVRSGITLCVNKQQKITRYVKDGAVLRTFDTNFGPEQGDPKFGQYSRTREGVNPIRSKDRNSVSTLYGYSMPYWMGFDGGIGFHYSKYFNQTGYADTSMGCTILRNEAEAKWLFEHTPMGTRVVVY